MATMNHMSKIPILAFVYLLVQMGSTALSVTLPTTVTKGTNPRRNGL